MSHNPEYIRFTKFRKFAGVMAWVEGLRGRMPKAGRQAPWWACRTIEGLF